MTSHTQSGRPGPRVAGGVGAICLAALQFLGCAGGDHPERRYARLPTVTEANGLATRLDRGMNGVSAVCVASDSVLVAWTVDRETEPRPFVPSRTIHWCYLGSFGSGDQWSRTNRVDLGADETAELLHAGEREVYLLGRPSRRLFHVEPDLTLRLVNRLDPPQAMAWQRFDAAVVAPDRVVGAATGLVPADSGGVRQAVGVGTWRLAGDLITWQQIAGGPLWPAGGFGISVFGGPGRPVVVTQLAYTTGQAPATGRSPTGAREHFVATFTPGRAPDWAGPWPRQPLFAPTRELAGCFGASDGAVWVCTQDAKGFYVDVMGPDLAWSPGARLPRVRVGSYTTHVLCVPSPGGRAVVVHLDPEDHRFDPDNLVIALALHGLPERVRFRSAVGVAQGGAVRDIAGAHLRGEVDHMAGAATEHGGVIVYETSELNWLQDKSTQRLRVLRYAWPR